MKLSELSVEEQALVNTTFPAELEKEASEQVKVAQELYSTGFSKFAAETAETLEKLAEEEEKEEPKEDEKKLDDEQKKEAAARGAFIARGYIDGLKKLGTEKYQDENAYLYPFINEKLANMGKALAFGKDLAGKAGEHAGKALAAGKGLAGKAGEAGGKALASGKALAAAHPKAALGAAAGGGALAGAAGLKGLQMMGRKKEPAQA